MRTLICVLVLLAAPLAAQTIVFAEQPFSRIPGLREYRVYVAAPAGRPMQVEGMKVILEALHQSIRVYSYPSLTAYVQEYNRRSPARYVGIGIEIAGWLGTSIAAGKVALIKERWITAGMPLFSATLTLARTYYDREYRSVQVPSDLMQPLFAVPEGKSVEFSVWAQ